MPTSTITYTVAEGQRIASAFGRRLKLVDGGGLPRPATEPEVRAALIAVLKDVVLSEERRVKQAAITDDPFAPT